MTDGPTDDQLIEWWGFVVEGFATVGRLVDDDLARATLPATWFEVLLRLRRTPGHRLAASRLAAEVSFSSGGLSKLIDRMEAARLVRRVPCTDDRRVVWVSLTPPGRRRVDRAMRDHATLLREQVLDVLGPTGFAELATSMRSLRDLAGRSTTARRVG